VIVIDTNVISELTRPDPSSAVRSWIELNSHLLTTTAITVAELFRGIAMLPGGRRRQRLQDATEQVIGTLGAATLSFDEGAARLYAQVAASRTKDGRPIATEDGMIAAICVRSGAALATRNVADFEGLGLALIDPWAS